jgi:hypothetical protein
MPTTVMPTLRPTQMTPTRRIGMPSAAASTSSRGGATASVAVAAASQGQASSRARCARERPRGCGRARSTSGGGQRRCCAQEEGEGHRTRRVHAHTCAGRMCSTPCSCPGRTGARRAARRSCPRGPCRWRRRGRRRVATAGSGHPRAQTPASGRAEVGRRRVARRVEQPALPLVQGAPVEAIVGRAVVRSVARHCSPGGGGGGGEWIREKRVNAAGQTRGRPRYIGGRALTRLAAWLDVHQRQAFTARGRQCAGRRRCAEDDAMRDDDRPLSPTSRGHMTRGKFSRHFARISFVRSPRARPRRPRIAWARRMDEGPNPGEIEEPEARLGHFSLSG